MPLHFQLHKVGFCYQLNPISILSLGSLMFPPLPPLHVLTPFVDCLLLLGIGLTLTYFHHLRLVFVDGRCMSFLNLHFFRLSLLFPIFAFLSLLKFHTISQWNCFKPNPIRQLFFWLSFILSALLY